MARDRDTAAARKEVFDQLAFHRAIEHLDNWVNSADWTTSANYLNAHAEDLLTDAAMRAIAVEVIEQPGLLTYQGLLGLCRALGVQRAHALVTDRAVGSVSAAGTAHELDLARLRAGLDDESADAQLDHALAAVQVGALSEAEWAITRCRDTSASWERTALIRRLAEFTHAHPSLDLESLRQILTSTRQEQERGDTRGD